MSDGEILIDRPHAVLRGYLNELGFDQKDDAGIPTYDDPVKLRFGSFKPVDGRPGFYVAAISMDVLKREDGIVRRFEKGFIAFKLDPDPTIEVYLQRRADTTEDHDMCRLLRLNFKEGLDLGPYHTTPVASAPPPARASEMWSSDGHYVTQQQDDGNFVTYYLEVPFDKTINRPVWSAWSGKV